MSSIFLGYFLEDLVPITDVISVGLSATMSRADHAKLSRLFLLHPSMKQLVLDLSLTQPATLENFIGSRNAELLARLRDMLDEQSSERLVYLWGAAGSGKTHLLQAFTHAACRYGLNAEYVKGVMTKDLSRGAVVALDDVQRLDDAAQIALFNLYNHVREGPGVLLVSGDRAPAQLDLRQDLVTRLGWGLVYQVHPLTDKEKVQALQARAKARGFQLTREVTVYLLRHWQRDLPSLIAVLDALDSYSLETKRPITVPLLREILQPAAPPTGMPS